MAQYHLLKYLRQKNQRTRIDAVMSVAAIVHPFMGAPQVYQVYSTQETRGLSIWTWLAWLALGLIFLVYGIAHKLGPYILMQVLWIILDVLIIAGIILYG